jgi:DNA-binding SARP family transcriptional activator
VSHDRQLVVGPNARWFVLPPGDRAELQRYRAPRLILLALARHHTHGPGDSLTAEELIGCGWPGERMSQSAAGSRLRNALWRLRAMGLRDVLVTRDGGYALNARVTVVFDGEAKSAGPGR